jgi:hypothetical protein
MLEDAVVPRTYAQDIKSKFRPSDVRCMARQSIMLDDADWMCDASGAFGFDDHGNARHVYDYLSGGTMPPDGAWPQDWLDVYQGWMADGFQRGTTQQGEVK